MTQVAPCINIQWKNKQTNIWAEKDADKMSNTNFPSKQHAKSVFKSGANEENSY